jgi:hypothetical protein
VNVRVRLRVTARLHKYLRNPQMHAREKASENSAKQGGRPTSQFSLLLISIASSLGRSRLDPSDNVSLSISIVEQTCTIEEKRKVGGHSTSPSLFLLLSLFGKEVSRGRPAGQVRYLGNFVRTKLNIVSNTY